MTYEQLMTKILTEPQRTWRLDRPSVIKHPASGLSVVCRDCDPGEARWHVSPRISDNSDFRFITMGWIPIGVGHLLLGKCDECGLIAYAVFSLPQHADGFRDKQYMLIPG